MPCTMPSLYFNRTKENEDLRDLGDLLTHELDMVRETILAGETPDFSAYDNTWGLVIDDAEDSLRNERSGPSSGVLTDANLLGQVKALWKEYNFIKSEWRLDKCVTVRNMIEAGQVIHRRDDLKRLAHTFIETGDMPMLRKAIDADPTKPLTEQLGFDPHDY